MATSKTRSGLWGYAITGVLATVGAVIVHQLWRANLQFPLFPPIGDAPLTQAAIFKGLLHHSWFFKNPSLGAPFGLPLRDFPCVDVIVALWVKAASLATQNDVLIANVYLLASYPMAALVSHVALRRLNVDHRVAIGTSLLFAFLSFHPLQLAKEPLLGVGYVTVPLVIELALSLLAGKKLLFDAIGGYRCTFVNSRETWLCLGACALIGATGNLWFPVIACYAMLIAGLLALARNRSRIVFLRCVSVAGLIGIVSGMSAWPALSFAFKHGRPASLLPTRDTGLRLGQLVFPEAVRGLAKLSKGPSDAQFLRLAEQGSVYLGVLISLGCAVLFFSLLRGGKQRKHIRALAVLNAASLLLGVSGALPVVARSIPLPRVDSSRLVSVYVAYTALVALALLSNRWLEHRMKTPRQRWVATIAFACSALFGLWDQRVVLNVDYDALRTRTDEWRHAMKVIEHAFPAKSSLFQLPNVPLPEPEPPAQLEASEQLMPYLYSSSLRFSYGSVGARRAGAFIHGIAAQPAEQIVERLVFAGFSGVLVANKGYPDHGEQIRGFLNDQLGRPLVTLHGDISVYSLLQVKAKTLRKFGEKEFERRRAELNAQLYWGWLEGCYPSESGAIVSEVRCESKGRFVIENPTPLPIHVVLEAKLRVAPVNTRVMFQGSLFHRDLVIEHSVRDLSEGFDVPPGESFVCLSVDGVALDDRNGREIAITFEEPHFASIVR